MGAGRVGSSLLAVALLVGGGVLLATACSADPLPAPTPDDSCPGCSDGFVCPSAAGCCRNTECVRDGSGGSGGDGGAGGTGGTGGAASGCAGGCPAGTTCNVDTDSCVSTDCTPACDPGYDCRAGVCFPGTGAVGFPCATGAECLSGECARAVTGEGACVQPCGATCPTGTRCLASADRCVADTFRECDGTLSCTSGVCTYWTIGAGYAAGCASEAGAGASSAPCTGAADCASGLCSQPPATGPSVCTAPCSTDFGCSGIADLCTTQQLDLGGQALETVQACAAPDGVGGTFGDCCAVDGDCDRNETTGCLPGADGVTMSCGSLAPCVDDADCFFSLPVGIREGNCLNSVCVSATCFPRP